MKRLVLLVLLVLCGIILGSGSGCSNGKKAINQPDITQVRSICNLATLECYYHNVAKSEKTAGSFAEIDRKFWIEYTGIAKIGIDMSEVDMKIDGEKITVVLPPAKLLSIDISENDLNESSYILEEDTWFFTKNKITAEDQTNAINNAQSTMAESVKNNTSLLLNAQSRAQDLIENYINQMGEISGINYTIEWVYETEEATE